MIGNVDLQPEPFSVGDEVIIQLPEVINNEHDCSQRDYCDCQYHGEVGIIISFTTDDLELEEPCSEYQYTVRLNDVDRTFPARHHDLRPLE